MHKDEAQEWEYRVRGFSLFLEIRARIEQMIGRLIRIKQFALQCEKNVLLARSFILIKTVTAT